MAGRGSLHLAPGTAPPGNETGAEVDRTGPVAVDLAPPCMPPHGHMRGGKISGFRHRDVRLRALKASGDFDAYWAFHEQQDFRRNHLERYAAKAIPKTRISPESGRKPHLSIVP